VTRAVVLELCRRLGLPTAERSIGPEPLRQAEGVFLSLSSWGVVQAASLDGRALATSSLTEQLRCAYDRQLADECPAV
jgi:branched-subunit amino acid aminotransferase/4-amino-4-deoxychorismate lyase